MLFRVRDVLPVIAEHVRGSGVDITCDPEATREALATYNRLNEILMNRDDWPGSDFHVRFPVHSGRVVLPERFETIKQVSIDGTPAPIFPIGWQFLESGPGECIDHGLICLGQNFPLERDLPKPLPLFAVSDSVETKGAFLLVSGYDTSNKFKRVKVPIAKAAPTSSPRLTTVFSSVTAIAKPLTVGHVDVGGWDNAAGPYWLARMSPEVESPNFTRYHLPGLPTHCRKIVAQVSLKFRDLYNLDDVSLIQHREAYRLACQGVTAFDDDNTQLGSEFLGRAIKMLKDRVAKLQQGQRRTLNVSSSRTLTRRHHNNRLFR
jgi:hypothetical protein